MVVTLQPETIMRRTLSNLLWISASIGAPLAQPLGAQDTRSTDPLARQRVRVETPLVWTSARDRAVLGVTLGASTRSDTAGVRIEDVDANGPAAKAGIKSGDVITDINGVSLRVTAADAEDLALAGIAQRRLQRTLAKAKPGDDVSLRVRSGGTSRAVTVKTVSAAELDGSQSRAAARIRTDDDDRSGAIGLSVGGTGSARDTLGLFVSSVVGNGPAEKAGVIEGERIAAVNGVDVRVPREDVEDPQATSARVNRFVREVRKVAPGGTVTLRVYANGRSRDVTVTAVKMSDLPSQGFQMSIGDGSVRILRGAPGGSTFEIMPFGDASPRAGAGTARIRGFMNGQPFEFDGTNIEQSMERLRERMQELGRDFRFEFRGSAPGRTDGVVRVQPSVIRRSTVL
jgi:S1-C subfamily serine protease